MHGEVLVSQLDDRISHADELTVVEVVQRSAVVFDVRVGSAGSLQRDTLHVVRTYFLQVLCRHFLHGKHNGQLSLKLKGRANRDL